MVFPFAGRKRLFKIVPTRLCRSKRVIAVADGKLHGFLCGAVKSFEIAATFESVKRFDNGLCVVYAVARHVPARHIQFKIIQLGEAFAVCVKVFYYMLLSVVD